MILFLLACGSSTPEPSEAPAPAPETPEPAPAPAPARDLNPSGTVVGNCTATERMRFSCEVGKGRNASLCEGADGLVYRFGKPDALELSVPSTGYSDTFEVSHRRTGEDAETYIASAWNDGYRYAIVSERTEDQFEGEVAVRQGAEPIATVACKGPVSADFTELEGRFQGDPTEPGAWVGHWLGGEADFTITQSEGGFAIEGGATWHGRNPGQVHTGEVKGPLAITGDTARYDTGCELTLKRKGPGEIEARDDGKCGGVNVTFSWTYTRAP